MSFFRKRFGSKNRKNFKPGVETKQTVDGQKTEEKYSTYDEKKKHEAKLWADLLKEPLLEYNEENAAKLKVNYVAKKEDNDKKDINYKTQYKYFYIKQMLQRLLPDKQMRVTNHKHTVTLSTLVGKNSESRTVNVLQTLRTFCTSPSGEYKFQVLRDFLDWLMKKSHTLKPGPLKSDITKLRSGDLMSLLKKYCINSTLCGTETDWARYEYGDPAFAMNPETLEIEDPAWLKEKNVGK